MSPDISPVSVNFPTEDLPTRPETLIERLEALGLPHTVHRHPAVFTVAESEKIDAQIPGAHTGRRNACGTISAYVPDR